jgi:COP9 signalosome complex subunit 4
MSLASKLSDCDKITKSEDKVKAYQTVIDSLFDEKDVNAATQLLEHILHDSFAPVVGREIVLHFAKSFNKLPNNDVLELGNSALEMIQSKNMLEEEEALIRNEVATVYQAKKQYADAAKCLTKIKLENSIRNVSLLEKATTYVTIAENWFYEDDAVNAEIFLNKATHVILDVEDEDINIRYRYCKGKVFDSKRKFVLAAQSYYELSSKEGDKIDEENKLSLLKNAVICAILASVGPQKSRLLTTLHKDERTRSLDNFEMLERMFNEKVINKKLMESFDKSLEDHQRATGSDGNTPLDT